MDEKDMIVIKLRKQVAAQQEEITNIRKALALVMEEIEDLYQGEVIRERTYVRIKGLIEKPFRMLKIKEAMEKERLD